MCSSLTRLTCSSKLTGIRSDGTANVKAASQADSPEVSMRESLLASRISPDDFNVFLRKYESTVPEPLRELDKTRWETVPTATKQRADKSKNSETWLEKSELEDLVRWKLYVPFNFPLMIKSFSPMSLARAVKTQFPNVVPYLF